ncbi:MAG: hypothetical protein MUC29_13400, partial [Pyrinomonadaceae bacterium]|nr:hypothetical protein [Pyrinomonadaceae bacterium]
MTGLIETVPMIKSLPISLPREKAVEIDVEQGVMLFRVSKKAQDRIDPNNPMLYLTRSFGNPVNHKHKL